MPSINDDIADSIRRHTFSLFRYDASLRRQVLRLLSRMEREIVETLLSIDPTHPPQEKYRQIRLKKLLEQVTGIVRASYREAALDVNGQLRELAEVESEFARRIVNRKVRAEIADKIVSPRRLRALVDDLLIQGAPTREWWSRQAGDVLQRFKDQVRLGMAQGESVDRIVRRIRGGMQDGVQIPGFMDAKKHQAEALVRSSVMTVSNSAQMESYKENERIVESVVWLSTFDTRTSFFCISRSGLEYTLDGDPIGHDLPWMGGPGAIHFACRSTATVRLKPWRDMGANRDEIPPSTRSSMDGQIPEDVKIDKFIDSRTESQQDSLLGKGVADLWRQGKLTHTDLVDQSGRPLTLEQIRRRIGVED